MFSLSADSIALRLRRQAQLSVTQPLSQPVSSNDDGYLAVSGYRKLGWRQVRRAMYLQLSGQQPYCHAKILPEWKRGLWLYKGIPQIGDALMDLAPRCLLAEHGLTMDLYTDPHLAAMFGSDPWFEKVLSDPRALRPADYDFIIVPSFKRRSLKHKIGLLRKLPWISMHGFYTGPEFNRGEFAARRLADALGVEPAAHQLLQHAQQKLKALPTTPSDSHSRLKMALVLGGVDPLRSYRSWPEFASQLGATLPLDITLLGSANALDTARAFESRWNGPLHNWVDKTDLAQCRQLMSEQRIVLACDGGLMHLATTTPIALISLFTSTVEPAWRLPRDRLTWALKSGSDDVNDIDPGEIASVVRRFVAAR